MSESHNGLYKEWTEKEEVSISEADMLTAEAPWTMFSSIGTFSSFCQWSTRSGIQLQHYWNHFAIELLYILLVMANEVQKLNKLKALAASDCKAIHNSLMESQNNFKSNSVN